MNNAIELLSNVSAGTVLAFLVGLAAILGVVFANLEKYHKLRTEMDKHKEHVEEALSSVTTLEERINKIEQTYDGLVQSDAKISEQLQEISSAVTRVMEYNKERDMADLKDRIRHHYSVYHSAGQITTMEKESLEDLIKSYEEAGGSNSFVHSVVEPELYTWKVVKP